MEQLHRRLPSLVSHPEIRAELGSLSSQARTHNTISISKRPNPHPIPPGLSFPIFLFLRKSQHRFLILHAWLTGIECVYGDPVFAVMLGPSSGCRETLDEIPE